MSKTMEDDSPAKGTTLPNGTGTAGDKGLRRTPLNSAQPAPRGIPRESTCPAQDDSRMREFLANGQNYDALHENDKPVRPRRAGTKN